MTRKIKILYTIPNFDTAGSGKVVVDLVKGLDKNRFEPHICCTHSRGAYFKVVQELGVPIHILSFFTAYKPYATLPFRVLKITRFFKKHKFDLIHSWQWSSDFTEPLAAKLAGIPYVYTKKAMGWGNKAWHLRTSLSTKIIALNTDMIEGFLKPYVEKVVYMPLGVDTEEFKPLTPKRELPSGQCFKEDDFVLVSIANLVPVKGIEVLLEAVQKLDNPKIKVLIVGDNKNDYGQKLRNEYKNSNIVFIDKKTEVKPYLAVADLFVIPTRDEGRKEGLPIAPLEAMASGRIVVGSNISGIKDILKTMPEQLFQPGNVQELAEKIYILTNMPEEDRKKLVKTMRELVEEQFSLKGCILAHETIYNQLTNKK